MILWQRVAAYYSSSSWESNTMASYDTRIVSSHWFSYYPKRKSDAAIDICTHLHTHWVLYAGGKQETKTGPENNSSRGTPSLDITIVQHV